MDGLIVLAGKFVSWYSEEWSKNPVKLLFISLLAILEIIFLAAVIVTKGGALDDVLFEIKGISGSDLFDCLRYDLNMGSDIYTPMAQSFFVILTYLTYPIHSYLNYNNAVGLFFYFSYYAIIYSILLFYYHKYSTQTLREKIIVFAMLTFSLPSLYCLERGNIIIFVALLILMFLYYYKSEDIKRRYFAYCCLGVAVGFKLYPAIFAFLILKDREYRQFLECVLISLAIFFVPFLFTNGTIEQQFHNIFGYAGKSQNDVHWDHINIENILMCLACALNISVTSRTLNWICYGLAIMLFISGFVNKEGSFWKTVACFTLIAIGCTGFRPIYAILVLIPALILFLDNEKQLTKSNIIYLICFILMFAPMIQIFLYINGVETFGGATIGHIGLTTILEGVGIIVMTLVLIIDLLPSSLKTVHSKICKNGQV